LGCQILIWAGSTTVGLYAISLARLAGIPIISTASPHNHELVKRFGANEVFDYRDPDVLSKIKQWGEQQDGGIEIGLDAISDHGWYSCISRLLQKKEKKKKLKPSSYRSIR
jgi:NADPH:quinone reductase-like Zn-dependent oxidoreductase